MSRTGLTLLALAVCTLAAFADDTRPLPASTRAVASTLPTAQEVLDRYVVVTGGAAAHAAVHSRRAAGIYTMPDLGLEGRVQYLARDDGAASLTIDLPGIGTIRQGVAPSGTAWTIHPLDGPRLLRGDDAAALRRSLSLSPELILDGYRNVQVVDLVPLNGRPAYRMDLIGPGGIREQRFYDQESGLLVRTLATTATTQTTSPAAGITVATYFSDYSDVAPIRLPVRIRQAASGLSPELILKHVEHNVELPDELFAVPPEIDALRRRPASRAATTSR